MRYHLTPVRMAINKKIYKKQMLERVYKKGNPLTLLEKYVKRKNESISINIYA